MLRVLHSSWALLLGMLLLMLGNGLQGTLLGVRGAIEQIDPGTLGFVMAGYFLGFLGGSRITPILLRRVGHVRVFAAFGSLVSAAFILYAAIVDPLAWFLLRLLVGFCFSGIYVVAESWLNHSATNDTRGQALSMYLMVQMTGIILGQLLLNLADPSGYELFVLISVLVSLSFAPMLLSSSPAPVFETARAMSIRELIEASPLACFGTLMLGGVFSILFGMAAVYATELGLSVARVSVFVTAIYFGGLIFQFPIGWLSDRMDRRLLIIAITAIGTAASLSSHFLPTTIASLVVIALFLGGVSNPLYSLLIAYANDHLEVEQMPAASGGLLFINGLGAMSGPIVVGYLMEHFGLQWFFDMTTLLLASICLYGLYRVTQRPTIIVDAPAPYLPVSSRTTAVATEIAIEVADEAQLEADEDAEESDESLPIDDVENGNGNGNGGPTAPSR